MYSKLLPKHFTSFSTFALENEFAILTSKAKGRTQMMNLQSLLFNRFFLYYYFLLITTSFGKWIRFSHHLFASVWNKILCTNDSIFFFFFFFFCCYKWVWSNAKKSKGKCTLSMGCHFISASFFVFVPAGCFLEA